MQDIKTQMNVFNNASKASSNKYNSKSADLQHIRKQTAALIAFTATLAGKHALETEEVLNGGTEIKNQKNEKT